MPRNRRSSFRIPLRRLGKTGSNIRSMAVVEDVVGSTEVGVEGDVDVVPAIGAGSHNFLVEQIYRALLVVDVADVIVVVQRKKVVRGVCQESPDKVALVAFVGFDMCDE